MEQLLISNAEYLGLKERQKDIEAKFYKAEKALAEATENLEISQENYDEAEFECGLVEVEKIRLSKIIRDAEVKELSNTRTLTGDAFADGLIIASWFCRHGNSPKPALEYIKVDENKLTAVDGFQGIEITCNSIPEQYRNSYIYRQFDNLQGITARTNLTYPNVKEIFTESTYKHKSQIDVVSTRNKWIGEGKEIYEIYKDAVFINLEKAKFLFNENLLKNGLDAISGNQEADIFYTNNKNPLLFKTHNMKVIVLPMRFPKNQGVS